MFIQTQDTPNPETVKFVVATQLPQGKTLSFAQGDVPVDAPLATHLLQIQEVAGLFFSSDFVSVTKSPSIDWSVLKPIVLAVILDFFATNRPAFNNIVVEEKVASEDEEAIVTQIKEVIETRVRPAVAQDGGDIAYRDFKDGIVYLEMHGACSGCPSATFTLKNGIENLLKHYVPEVQGVEAV